MSYTKQNDRDVFCSTFNKIKKIEEYTRKEIIKNIFYNEDIAKEMDSLFDIKDVNSKGFLDNDFRKYTRYALILYIQKKAKELGRLGINESDAYSIVAGLYDAKVGGITWRRSISGLILIGIISDAFYRNVYKFMVADNKLNLYTDATTSEAGVFKHDLLFEEFKSSVFSLLDRDVLTFEEYVNKFNELVIKLGLDYSDRTFLEPFVTSKGVLKFRISKSYARKKQFRIDPIAVINRCKIYRYLKSLPFYRDKITPTELKKHYGFDIISLGKEYVERLEEYGDMK